MTPDYPDYESGRQPAAGYDREAYEQPREYHRIVSASAMTGDRVRNRVGEDLGKIEEIMIDVPTGRVAYAVIGFGGFLGIGDKLLAVPWHALTLDERDRIFILDVDRRELERAPALDRDHWPDMADPAWRSQVDQFYAPLETERRAY